MNLTHPTQLLHMSTIANVSNWLQFHTMSKKNNFNLKLIRIQNG